MKIKCGLIGFGLSLVLFQAAHFHSQSTQPSVPGTVTTSQDQQSLSLTIYNSNLGLVKDIRRINLVNEPIGGDWRILQSTHNYEKTAAFAARFSVPVEKNGEAKLNYRVRVRY